MKLKQDIISILSECTVDEGGIQLPGTLERKMYTKVNEVLETLGCVWNRKAKRHVYKGELSPKDLLEAVMLAGEVKTEKELKQELGFFPTPADTAAFLVGLAEVQPGDIVLEPSAGTGRIVEALSEAGVARVFVCERDPNMRSDLAKRSLPPGSELVISPLDDFLDTSLHEQDLKFDKVVMNPPFAKSGKGDQVDHVLHAFKMLKPGGTLVSVMASNIKYREDKRFLFFRGFLKDIGAEVTDMPPDSFKESGTGVSTVVVKIRNPG